MERATRIPPAVITGVKGALIKRMIQKKLGKVPTAVGVYWHNPKVLFAIYAIRNPHRLERLGEVAELRR